jgi:hypothetical protein
VTAERRLDKVEAALTPTQRVVAWLDDAHRYGTLSAYIDSLLDKPPDDFPINRLAHGAAAATPAALRGNPAETVGPALRKAVLGTVFRFHLVLRSNVVTHETIDRETLIYVAMAGQHTVAGIRRVLEIVVADSVGQEHGIARLRVLIAAAGAATNLLKVAELEDRLAHSQTLPTPAAGHPTKCGGLD